ncbi:serine/threonine-protein kinase [Actinomadura sp. 21ATH]|uniref:serine/threonine-protein kinase n=1 Tax=Actinomadura sp. 21ATH TaxID=1735444 RepID=UPI0035C1ACF6
MTQPLSPADPARLGAYEILARLGTGGQGVVYLGRAGDGEVAIKLLHARTIADAGARARFVRELSLLQRVAGFCTAQMLEADMAGDRPYIVSEYIPGPSLRQLVDDRGPRTGADLDRLAIRSVTALTAIHRAGIVHRDFKPQNVLMGPDGPRVIDFGIARALDSEATLTSQIIGTPAYMAPEQFAGTDIGPAADLFAWALTLLFAATGRDPFSGPSVPVVMYRIMNETPDVSVLPDEIADVARACLRKDPAGRPTAEEALLWLLGESKPPPPAPHKNPDPGPHPWSPPQEAGPPPPTPGAPGRSDTRHPPWSPPQGQEPPPAGPGAPEPASPGGAGWSPSQGEGAPSAGPGGPGAGSPGGAGWSPAQGEGASPAGPGGSGVASPGGAGWSPAQGEGALPAGPGGPGPVSPGHPGWGASQGEASRARPGVPGRAEPGRPPPEGAVPPHGRSGDSEAGAGESGGGYRRLPRSAAVVVGLVLAGLLAALDVASLAILVARPELSEGPGGRWLPVVAGSFVLLAVITLVGVVLAWRGSRAAAWTVLVVRVLRVALWGAWSPLVAVQVSALAVHAGVTALVVVLLAMGLRSR